MTRRTNPDMTQGPILSSLLAYAYPLMLGSLFQDLYHVVDMAIAGYTMGDDALAAISSTSVITTLINPLLNGFCIGCSVQIANRYGEKNDDMTRQCVTAMSLLCVGLMVFVMALMITFIKPVLELVKIPDTLKADAFAYIRVILFGIPATLLYDLCANIFRALGNSKTPLIVLILSTFSNTALDYLFMVPLHMGVEGAALATIISQGAAAIFAGALFLSKYPSLRFTRTDLRNSTSAAREMLPYGISGAFTNSVFAIGAAAIQGTVNSLGTDVIVSQAAANKIKSFAMIPSGGLANAAATFSAQNHGAGNFERIKKGVHTAIYCSMICTAVLFVLIRISDRSLIVLITHTQNRTVIDQAEDMLNIVIPFIFCQTALMSYRMAMQGMCHKIIPIIGMSIELVIRCTFAFLITPRIGYRGIAYSEPASWIISGAAMGMLFYKILRQNMSQPCDRS